MKAFFNRLAGKDRDKEQPQTKEKFPPLRQWPPQEEGQQRPQSTPAVVTANFKPLPELVPSQFLNQLNSKPLPTTDHQDRTASMPQSVKGTSSEESAHHTTRQEHEVTPKVTRRNTKDSTRDGSAANDVQKKVAFISPPPTPTPNNFDRALPDSPPTTTAAPSKTPLSRFQAAHGSKELRNPPVSGTPASSSRPDLSSPPNKNSAKATSTRTSSSPYLQRSFEAASAPSLRSGTPYSSMSNTSSGSRILAATSWSEVTEGDLVSNIGSRERTRQEVLFEIIQSEDRYVQELIKFKDTFIDPLLHPYATSIAAGASTPNLEYDYYRADSPMESAEELPPIAARFMSPTPGNITPHSYTHRSKEVAPVEPESMDSDEEDDAATAKKYNSRKSTVSKHDHPRSPYRIGASRSTGRASGTTVPFPSRSHHSLPPPPHLAPTASTHSLGRQSTVVEEQRDRKYSQGNAEGPPRPGVLRKFKKSQSSADGVLGNTLAPHQIPEDLRICLEAIDGGVFDGHKRLCEALKKRYDDQYPLVRSLADVFVSNSDIFAGYAKYVLHLERALEQVDSALSNVSTKKPKKQDATDWLKVCKALQKLEENAIDKGETGLAITLSKPFQRLLKYPLLFQNLLFHTDPSTFEYESTLQMVAEVENIVRSIEDEKIQKEERDKTRDIFARIEGLDKVRQLALPKPSRVLVEERACTPGSSPLNASTKVNSPPPVVNGKGVRGKSSFKRLSDVLVNNGIGGKKDLWFVVFNDVVLQCQRTGTTSLPLVASLNSRTNSLPDFQGKSKYATTGRRNSYTKPRNLYKFIKIETWTIGDVPREGVVSMDDVVRTRSQVISNQPRMVPMPDDKEEESDGDSSDSDKKSKMSFSYWGADKITVQKPVIRGKPGAGPRRGAIIASYGRESSANAKFGTRLVSDGSNHARPTSRRPGTTTPVYRRPPTASGASHSAEEGPNYAKSTVTRPAWDTSTRTPPPNAVIKRVRNVSQVSRATTTNTATQTPVPVKSPAPSEDSGA